MSSLMTDLTLAIASSQPPQSPRASSLPRTGAFCRTHTPTHSPAFYLHELETLGSPPARAQADWIGVRVLEKNVVVRLLLVLPTCILEV
jgi:hypothetical protein